MYTLGPKYRYCLCTFNPKVGPISILRAPKKVLFASILKHEGLARLAVLIEPSLLTPAIHPAPANRGERKLGSGVSGAYLGLSLGECMGSGSPGLCEILQSGSVTIALRMAWMNKRVSVGLALSPQTQKRPRQLNTDLLEELGNYSIWVFEFWRKALLILSVAFIFDGKPFLREGSRCGRH